MQKQSKKWGYSKSDLFGNSLERSFMDFHEPQKDAEHFGAQESPYCRFVCLLTKSVGTANAICFRQVGIKYNSYCFCVSWTFFTFFDIHVRKHYAAAVFDSDWRNQTPQHLCLSQPPWKLQGAFQTSRPAFLTASRSLVFSLLCPQDILRKRLHHGGPSWPLPQPHQGRAGLQQDSQTVPGGDIRYSGSTHILWTVHALYFSVWVSECVMPCALAPIGLALHCGALAVVVHMPAVLLCSLGDGTSGLASINICLFTLWIRSST